MSAATATKTPDYTSLRAFLQGTKAAKAASVDSPPTADSTIPPEPGSKEPSHGARSSENSSDTKEMPPGKNAEHGPENEETGNAGDPVPNSGLEQSLAGEGDSQTRAIKKIDGENEKIAGLDLTKDADLVTALAALQKAANALPELLAPSLPAKNKVAGAAPTADEAARAKWAAENQAAANTVAAYHKLGSERGRVVVAYLTGHAEALQMLKAAEDDGTMAQLMAGAGGGGDPAAMAGGGPAGPAGPMPPMPPDAGGGAPPMGPGAGGPMPPPGGPAEGGGVTADELSAALAEAGITPEELVAMLTQLKGKVDSGGGPPDGGGEGSPMPPDEKEKAAALIADWTKAAHDVTSHRRSGKFSFKPAADGTPERKSRDTLKSYIAELRAASA